MRYTQKKKVEEVLSWLSEKGVSIQRDSYQNFLRKLLVFATDAQAQKMQVDLDLLRAVRQRLRLPIRPKAWSRRRSPRRLPSFKSSGGRHAVKIRKKPELTPLPNRPARREQPASPHQLPLVGSTALQAADFSQIKGNVNNLDSLKPADWKILNALATEKIRLVDHMIATNVKGNVFHMTTLHEYTEEELIAQFGLHPAEAKSCYLSLWSTPDRG